MNNSDLHSKQLFQPQLFSIRAQGGDRTVIALGSVFEVGNALLFPWEEHFMLKVEIHSIHTVRFCPHENVGT